MRLSAFVAVAFAFVAASDVAFAQTRAERCSAYARQAARSSPTTTGPLRGAARGAAGGAIGGAIAGNAGRGAGIGAAVGAGLGTVRGGAQRSRSYQWYFDRCMSR
jgi:hypothetical protein